MKKLTLVLPVATALAAGTVGLAAPAMAAPSAGVPVQHTANSVVVDHSSQPLDACSVHVWYQGSLVDVNWC
ncbi:hypothetical protein [Mycobacterium sp.]|jgi:hypothetical protein|uniref:hypothetical protein n=1 Tax=Mycobacterium sp. TaxID=1785 RepID=UPI002D7310B3|nr:hypothetical protein [Mycobacterium sp.]HZA10159.1 hypothetical protein [Mycobacterium sp.]